MGAQNNENNPHSFVAYLGTVSDAGDYPVCHLPKRFKISKVVLLDQNGIAASDTNYVQLSLKKKQVGESAVEVAECDTRAAHEGAATANQAYPLNLDADESNVDRDSDLYVTYAEGGSGTLTGAQLQVHGYWI